MTVYRRLKSVRQIHGKKWRRWKQTDRQTDRQRQTGRQIHTESAGEVEAFAVLLYESLRRKSG